MFQWHRSRDATRQDVRPGIHVPGRLYQELRPPHVRTKPHVPTPSSESPRPGPTPPHHLTTGHTGVHTVTRHPPHDSTDSPSTCSHRRAHTDTHSHTIADTEIHTYTQTHAGTQTRSHAVMCPWHHPWLQLACSTERQDREVQGSPPGEFPPSGELSTVVCF